VEREAVPAADALVDRIGDDSTTRPVSAPPRRRHQLGRRRHRSQDGICVCEFAGQPWCRPDQEESRCRKGRPASILRSSGLFQLRRRRAPVRKTTVGAPVRGQRQHWRHRVAGSVGHHRKSPGRQTEHGPRRRFRRPWCDGWRAGVHWRYGRQPFPRVRFENRQGALGCPDLLSG